MAPGGEEDGKLPITDHRQLRCYSRIIKDIFAGLSEGSAHIIF